MKHAKFLVLLLVSIPAGASSARAQDRASPYIVPEAPIGSFLSAGIGGGARALGMGGAFLAVADDASAVSWNPAAMAQLAEPEAEISLDSTRQSADRDPGYEPWSYYTTTPSATFRLHGASLDQASVALPLARGGWRFAAGAGYARTVSFDLASRNSPYSLDAYFDHTRAVETSESSGGFDVLALSGAAGTGRVSGGVSLNLWTNGVDGSYAVIQQWSSAAVQESDVPEAWTTRIEQRISGVNATFGLLWRPWGTLSIGGVFRTPFTADLDETVHATYNYYTGYTVKSYAVADDASGTASVDWPWSLGIGVSARPAGKLLIALDYDRVNWSEARIHHPPAVADLMRLRGAAPYPSLKPQDDVEQYRLGGEYLLQARGLVFPVRAGLILDRLMIRDELGIEVIDYGQYTTVHYGDRVTLWGASAGGGVEWKTLRVDLGYVRESGSHRTCAWCPQGPAVDEDVTLERLLITGALRF